MAYRLKRSESVSQGVKRVAKEQLEKALAEIDDDQLDRHEAVHQARKRFKKIRGLIRLVRPAFEKTYQRENARFRDAGRDLSAVRDAQSLIEAFDRLTGFTENSGRDPSFAGIRERLMEQRREIAGEQADVSEVLAGLSATISEALEQVERWELKGRGFDAIAKSFEGTYERGQRAMEEARRPTADADVFHEWRKQVKYHWYHTRLLENLWKPVMQARSAEAKRLAELLGEDHDASRLDQWLAEHGEDLTDETDVSGFQKLIEKAKRKLRRDAFALGERLFAERPKHLSRRLRAWWSAWRESA